MDEEAEDRKPTGCGVLNMFRRPKLWHRRSSSTSSIPRCKPQSPTLSDATRFRGSDDTALVLSPHISGMPVARAPIKYKPSAPANIVRLKPRRSESSKALTLATPSITISGELNNMIYDHQRAKGSDTLVRATSGNVMVYGDLGNIRTARTSPQNMIDYPQEEAKEEIDMNGNVTYGTSWSYTEANAAKEPADWVMGNIVRKRVKEIETEVATPTELAKMMSKKLDPEELKKKGNAEFKKGRFVEAIDYYDRAISINPENASYHGNKAAALVGIGRLFEAIDECSEALRIDRSYGKAHYRLASLCLRLGETEKAVRHYKLSRNEASYTEISQAETLQFSLSKCLEARKLGDWSAVLKGAKSIFSAGADSAPQVFALQAEALLKLDRHDEAENTFNRAPQLDIDASTKFFGATKNSFVLMIRAEIDMAAGRFEDAFAIAQKSAQLDPGNRETSYVVRKAQGVTYARDKGNELYKASQFGEACMAYQEALQHVPRNAVLLCNRAACRSNLGQWDRAVEDCTMALNVRPSYAKARLRRAECNAKIERWEAAVRDYEILSRSMPRDELVSRALSEAQEKLQKQQQRRIRNTTAQMHQYSSQ